MPAFLGLRGTGDFATDERPKNWREKILQLFPNGEAPLTALLSKLKSEATDDPEFNWWEKDLPGQRPRLAEDLDASETEITVVSGAKDCVAGTIIMIEESGEKCLVTSTPTDDTTLNVQRGFGTTAATTATSGTYLVIVGNAHEEGASVPTAKGYSPTKVYNYTQIFRMPLSMTRTAKKTRLRTDNTGPYREAKREALSLHSIEMEKAFIWGEPYETTGSLGKPLRTTSGVIPFLSSNIGGSFAVGGTLDEPTWDSLLEQLFRYGSSSKLCLCGSTFLGAINTLAKRNGTLNMVPSDKTYGMKIIDYVSPFGDLALKMHPLFNQHSEWRKNALILDVQHLVYRYVDDTRFIPNRQDPGDDRSIDEFLTECGLELHHEEAHGYITGVTGALIS